MASTRQTRGRQKIAMKRIVNEDNRLVTFSKRRSGIYKKSSELITLCGAEVAVLVFSPAGKPFSFGHPSMESVISRYLGKEISPEVDMTHPLVEARQKVRINELNQQHNEMVSQVEAEKERAKLLKQIFKGKVGEYQGWWDIQLDELDLEELKEMLEMLEELHANFCQKISEKSGNNAASPSSVPMFRPHTVLLGGFGAKTPNEAGSSSCLPQGYGHGRKFSL